LEGKKLKYKCSHCDKTDNHNKVIDNNHKKSSNEIVFCLKYIKFYTFEQGKLLSIAGRKAKGL